MIIDKAKEKILFGFYTFTDCELAAIMNQTLDTLKIGESAIVQSVRSQEALRQHFFRYESNPWC